MAEYLKTINGSLLPIGGTNVYVEQMTQAEYDALPSATKDDNHFRVITDADGEPGLQASEIVSDDGNVQDDLNALFGKINTNNAALVTALTGKTLAQMIAALPEGITTWGIYGAESYAPTSGTGYKTFVNIQSSGGQPYSFLACWDHPNKKFYIYSYNQSAWVAIN